MIEQLNKMSFDWLVGQRIKIFRDEGYLPTTMMIDHVTYWSIFQTKKQGLCMPVSGERYFYINSGKKLFYWR